MLVKKSSSSARNATTTREDDSWIRVEQQHTLDFNRDPLLGYLILDDYFPNPTPQSTSSSSPATTVTNTNTATTTENNTDNDDDDNASEKSSLFPTLFRSATSSSGEEEEEVDGVHKHVSFSSTNTAVGSTTTMTNLLPEEVVLSCEIVDVCFLPDLLRGSILVSSYRFRFLPIRSHWRLTRYFEFPLANISKLFENHSLLVLHCRDGRQELRFQFPTVDYCRAIYHVLNPLVAANAVVSSRDLKAFSTSRPHVLLDEALSCQEPCSLSSRFRRSTCNAKYTLCSTYPSVLVVPSGISDEQLVSIARFRSEERIPVLSWSSSIQGTIWRCSQPLVGPFFNHNRDDEDFLGQLGNLLIVDCRGVGAVFGNQLTQKGGTETTRRYPQSETIFAQIGNMNEIRRSFAQLMDVINSNSSTEDAGFESASKAWLGTIRTLLFTSLRVAEQVLNGRSVLVHCTHGWDRTPQVVCLSQIMLDPQKRTLLGFVNMIHREWVLFGHQFYTRTFSNGNERSPIFLQFLDCVHQLVVLFPHKFEFSLKLLECLAHHSVSGRFVEFLGGSGRDWEERRQNGGASLWELLLFDSRSPHEFLVPDQRDGIKGVLLPPVSVLTRRLILWDYFLSLGATPSHPLHAFPGESKWSWWM